MDAGMVVLVVICVLFIPAIPIIGIMLRKKRLYPHPRPPAAAPPAAALFVNPNFNPPNPNPKPNNAATSNNRVNVDDGEIYDALDPVNPLAGLADVPHCTLEEAATHAQMHCNTNLQAAVEAAFAFAAELAAANRLGPLSVADAAAVHLYSQETPLYRYVNGGLAGHGGEGRDALPHYLPYIKLLLAALLKLPPQCATNVYRGIKLPLNTLIPNANVGQKVVWWAFTSTSRSKIAPKDFIGSTGTLFQISSNDGRDISRYSGANEEEVILLPGSQFVVDIICPYASHIEEVRMHQLKVDYVRSDGSDGDEPVYAEPVAPPVYDKTVYLVLEGGAGDDGDAAPSIDYTVHAGCTVGGGASNGGDAEYAEGGGGVGVHVNTAIYAAANVDANGDAGIQLARTNTASKCARGQASGGQKCFNYAAAGGQYCPSHTCTHQGCGNSKSSTGKLCGQHAAISTEVRPRASTAWEKSAVPPAAVKYGYVNVQDAAAKVKEALVEQQQPQPPGVPAAAVKHGYVNVQDAAAQIKAVAADIGPTALSTVGSAKHPVVAKGAGGKGIQRSAEARKGSIYDGFGDESGGGGSSGRIQRQSGARQGSVYTGFEGVEEEV
jgi:hypothetical protein